MAPKISKYYSSTVQSTVCSLGHIVWKSYIYFRQLCRWLGDYVQLEQIILGVLASHHLHVSCSHSPFSFSFFSAKVVPSDGQENGQTNEEDEAETVEKDEQRRMSSLSRRDSVREEAAEPPPVVCAEGEATKKGEAPKTSPSTSLVFPLSCIAVMCLCVCPCIPTLTQRYIPCCLHYKADLNTSSHLK